MTIHSIRDIVPKRMTQHPLPVVLPDAVFFTQSRKGMSTIVRRVLRVAGYPQSFQCRVKQSVSVLRLGIDAEFTVLRQDLALCKLIYGRMDWNDPVFSGCGLDATLKISLFKIGRKLQDLANSPSRVTHD